MTPKQAIYFEMLLRTMPHLRNVTTLSWWQRLRDRSAYFEAELIHNLAHSVFEPEFVDHDIWFLNIQARMYCERCSEALSPLYREQLERIRGLFAIVPEAYRDRLEWSGPQ